MRNFDIITWTCANDNYVGLLLLCKYTMHAIMKVWTKNMRGYTNDKNLPRLLFMLEYVKLRKNNICYLQ